MAPFEEELIKKAADFTREKMRGILSSHGWDHVKRVVKNAEVIARSETKADLFIVTISAILHDIARNEETATTGGSCHAEEGSRVAYEFLTASGLDPERAAHVRDCVRTHRYRDNTQPESLEAKILFDADKLDSIGAVGIGRAFLFAGEVGARLHNPGIDIETTLSYSEEDTAYREYYFKLRFVKESMLTESGREMALERHHYMEDFFQRLQKESLSEV